VIPGEGVGVRPTPLPGGGIILPVDPVPGVVPRPLPLPIKKIDVERR
jgi:hypothetical protein